VLNKGFHSLIVVMATNATRKESMVMRFEMIVALKLEFKLNVRPLFGCKLMSHD
jgi:hypothetical protein